MPKRLKVAYLEPIVTHFSGFKKSKALIMGCIGIKNR